MIRSDRIRVYPTSCTSAFCGRVDCTGCRHLPDLEAFKRWREERAAVADTWNTTVYTATR